MNVYVRRSPNGRTMSFRRADMPTVTDAEVLARGWGLDGNSASIEIPLSELPARQLDLLSWAQEQSVTVCWT